MDSLKILIADDDTIIAAILCKMLERYSDNILVAPNGKIGLELFRTHRPDIILSDINMPEMGGLEMVREIRQLDRDVKIAIFTNFNKRDILTQAVEYGVNQFFSKPFEVKHFSKVMEHLIEDVVAKRRIQAELDRQLDIMHAINQMGHTFLQNDDWFEALHSALSRLKKAAQISTIFLYQNDDNDNPEFAEKVLVINDNPKSRAREKLHYRKHHLIRWKKTLQSGEAVSGDVKHIDHAKQKLLRTFGVHTLLILPIFSGGRWWGLLGVGNTSSMPLAPSDIEMLDTVTSVIGSALSSRRHFRSLQMSSAVFKHTVDGVLITDQNNRIIQVNDAFCAITGYQPEQVIGKDPKLLKSGQHDVHFYAAMWRQIKAEGYWQGEITNRKANGEVYIEWLSINAIGDRLGNTVHYIGVFSDVTHLRKDAADQAYLATHDPLTGLSNRLLLLDRLNHAVAHADRFGKCVAVVFCDLDNFKPVNDTYGHMAGDIVLKTVAERFKDILRKQDTVCRYGGDEFVILLEELQTFPVLDSIVNKLVALSARAIEFEEAQLQVAISIGVAIYPEDAKDGASLIALADGAMYKAKHSGKNRVAFHKADPRKYGISDPAVCVPEHYTI